MKLREFFYFTKSDRQVLLLLLSLAAVIILFIRVLGGYNSRTVMTEADSLAMAERMEYIKNRPFHRYSKGQHGNQYYSQLQRRPLRLVPFDPNTADSTVLLGLGLQEWQVRSIYKYRAAGGVYRRPLDFARLYGLTRKQYRELEPYIRISDDYLPAATLIKSEAVIERDTVRYPVKIKPTERIEVNTADTSMLKRVPGIGSYFARRIVDYRQRLGGYYDKHQLLEIDGFPEEALTYLEIAGEPLRKIKINKASLQELKKHPYISFFQARDISDYRRLKGNIRSLSELKLLKDFPPKAIERLEPYMDYE